MKVLQHCLTVALSVSAMAATAFAQATIVDDNFDDMTNPGYFYGVNENVAGPTIDVSSGALNFSTTPTLNDSGAGQRYLQNAYVVRPFDAVDLVDVGDWVEMSFKVSAAPNDFGTSTLNSLRQIRGFKLALLGSGDETVPDADFTYTGDLTTANQDIELDGPSSFNTGYNLTIDGAQAVGVGNVGGTSTGTNGNTKFYGTSVGTNGTLSNFNLSQSLEDGSTITFRVTRAADGTWSTVGPSYDTTLTILHNDGLNTEEVINAGMAGSNDRADRVLGTVWDHLAIGSSQVPTLNDGQTGFVDFTIDDLKVMTNTVDLLIPGDADGDGDVDGDDFNAWGGNFPTASGATLAQGDFDGDGDVDGDDFNVWGGNFPYPGPSASAISEVPEPASFALIGLGAVALLRRRK